jgi:hypothetical protein
MVPVDIIELLNFPVFLRHLFRQRALQALCVQQPLACYNKKKTQDSVP